MKRFTRSAILMVLVGAGLSAAHRPQTPQAEHVSVSVIVRNRASRPVTGLQPSDFVVRIDGRPVQVSFVPAPSRTFLILMDFSSSMFGGSAVHGEWHSDNPRSVTGSKLGVVTREWARRGIVALGGQLQSGDRIRLGSFGARQLLTEPLSRPEDISGPAWSSILQSDGPSPIWDAVASAVGHLSDGRTRPIVVLVTDGRAAGSHLGFHEATELAVRSSVTVFTTRPNAALEERFGDRSFLDPRTALETLAARTGGRLLVPGLGSDFTQVVKQVLEDLGRHYTLSIPAAGIADMTSLSVTVPVVTGTIVVRQHDDRR